VAEFVPTKSQRRTLRRNADLTLRIGQPELNDEKVAVYQRYLEHQHPASPQSADPDGLREFLYQQVVDTMEVNYLKDGRVIAASILDTSEQSVSSVYHYFEPAESRRSLGVFSVLAEIELTRQWGVPYYYMGYWVAGSRTMDYKANYRPHEVLVDGQWRRVE
jgi:arginine-tRNA-protein transferase